MGNWIPVCQSSFSFSHFSFTPNIVDRSVGCSLASTQICHRAYIVSFCSRTYTSSPVTSMDVAMSTSSWFYYFHFIFFLIHKYFIDLHQLFVYDTRAVMMVCHFQVKFLPFDCYTPIENNLQYGESLQIHSSPSRLFRITPNKDVNTNLARFTKSYCPILDLDSLAFLPAKGNIHTLYAIKHPKSKMTREPQQQQSDFNDHDEVLKFSNKQIFYRHWTLGLVVNRPARESNDRNWLMFGWIIRVRRTAAAS